MPPLAKLSFSDGPRPADRTPRCPRRTGLPRPPGVGVGRPRRVLVRGDDEPAARAARGAVGRGPLLHTAPGARGARPRWHREDTVRDRRRTPGRGGAEAPPRRAAP